MNQHYSPFSSPQAVPASMASATERSDFIHRTYQHLALAVAAFVGVEALLLNIPGIGRLAMAMTSGFMWLLVIGGFMLVSRVAEKWAFDSVTPGRAYLGLGLYIVAEALIFVPLMYVAANFAGPSVIGKAAVTTGVTFAGLTAVVLVTKKDFSFMRGILTVVGFSALGLIAASVLFGFSLGSWFAWAMAAFAAGAIVYQTSNVMQHFRTDQHVAASLALFASVATLFYYVLMIFMRSDD